MHRQGERRNYIGSDPQSWQQATTASATTWPALSPTSGPEIWQLIHGPGTLNNWAPAILAPHLTLNGGRSPLRPTTTASGRRVIEAPEPSLPCLLLSGLTPKLSGRARTRIPASVGDRSWHFIHGRSAQASVRSLLQVLIVALMPSAAAINATCQ